MIVVSLKVVALVLSLLSSPCHKHGMKVRRVFAAKHLDETRWFEMKSIRLSHCIHMKLCCVCLMVCVFIPPTRYGHFSGINRKVQLTYLRNGKPKASSEEEGIVLGHRLLCVLGHSDKLYVNKYTRMVIGSECQCNQSSVSNCVLEPRLQCFGCTSPRTTLFVSMATEKRVLIIYIKKNQMLNFLLLVSDSKKDGPSLLLVLKWGGELTPAGRVQAEELGRAFRCMYPGGQGTSQTHALAYKMSLQRLSRLLLWCHFSVLLCNF